MNIIEITKVYIIESQSSTEILEGRNEGAALRKNLNIAGIKHLYFNVTTIEELKKCFNEIFEDIKNHPNKFHTITLHFLMQGDVEQIFLTNKKFISWKKLYSILKEFEQKIFYREKTGNNIFPVNINFSACKGFYAKRIHEFSNDNLYFALIGPTREIDKSVSIIAFTTFYNYLIIKKSGFKKAVERMNNATGLEDIFELDLYGGLKLK